MMQIKVGYLVAYDYDMLRHSLPTVYEAADTIVLAIDKNRVTFAGRPFTIPTEFFHWLKSADPQNKIKVYEDEFYKPGLDSNQADTRARNLLGKEMGDGGWHLQIDVDEYFVKFSDLIEELRKLEQKITGKKVTVMAYLSSIFKTSQDGYFMVANPEKFALATNNPIYTQHRYNNEENQRIDVNHILVHQSWGRTEGELKTKLDNWGHRHDFDTDSYFRFWKSLNADNYTYVKDFHPLNPGLWGKLNYVRANSIEKLLEQVPYKIEVQTEKFSRLRKWLPPVVYNRLAKI